MNPSSSPHRGSEWRKWDLHVHTPASYDWDKGCKKSVEDIVDAAVTEGLSAIAITDHHSVASVDAAVAHGKKKGLFVIPGIELRTNQGNDKIHIIGLFPEGTASKAIHEKVLCPLGFSDEDIKQKGDEQVYCDFQKACELVHGLGGLVFLHAGSKSNGIEQLDSDTKKLLKTDLAFMVDIFEVNAAKQGKDYRDIVFPVIKREFPCLITSDSVDRSTLTYGGHSIEVIGKAFSWIKADLTFKGLRQIISEPIDRVCLESTPQKLVDVQTHPTRYIDSLKVCTESGASGSWFDCHVHLSQELTAVIGKKGSGKSAFVDIVALCGKSGTDPAHYSFLRREKFRRDPATAKKYKGELTWKDGELVEMNLNGEVSRDTEPERVKYLPQKFVEEICDDNGVSSLFQNEIDQVIFSYVPEEKRLGTTSLQALIQKQANALNSKVTQARESIDETNAAICALEDKKRPGYRQRIENELDGKQKAYDAIKDPTPVPEPKDKLPKGQAEKLQKLEEDLTQIEEDISAAKEERRKTTQGLTFLDGLEGKIDKVVTSVSSIHTTLKEEANEIGLDIEEVVSLSIDRESLTTKRGELKKKETALAKKLDVHSTDPKVSLYAKQRKLTEEKKAISDSFTEQHRKYDEYKRAKKKADDERKEILGAKNDTSLATINSLKNELAYLDKKLDKDLESKYRTRTELAQQLVEGVLAKIELYKEIYQPLIDFIEQEKKRQEDTGNMLTFDAGVVFDKAAFASNFLKFIDHGRDGSFQGKEAGAQQLRDILNKYSLTASDDLSRLANELLQCLAKDITKDPPGENDLQKQLRAGYEVKALYDFLYKAEYLDVRFKILFNGKDLNENIFSPGEKGALLLIFYLLIDKERIPLIMDQPEENLDNETVFKLLVPYIKRAKKDRQIIIVTHNPNLAVVCDAEQVISATMDKTKSEIRYSHGSIENPDINRKLVDTLEGTMPAFTKRDEKYHR